VKSRTIKDGDAYIAYQTDDEFDWLAIVLLPRSRKQERQFFLIPKAVSDDVAYKNKPTTINPKKRYRISDVPKLFSRFENNFSLEITE
jgi:hypothetical protein